jgi:hypothetical protein
MTEITEKNICDNFLNNIRFDSFVRKQLTLNFSQPQISSQKILSNPLIPELCDSIKSIQSQNQSLVLKLDQIINILSHSFTTAGLTFEGTELNDENL